MQKFMLTPLFFTKILFDMETNNPFNNRHSMLSFPIFVAVPSAYYYLSMEDKYQIFYVSSSCLFTSLTVTDIIEYELEVIENIIC